MSTLSLARAQMELSLAFHMVFAALGIGLPALMTAAEWRALRGDGAHYGELARSLGKATALLFVVGAVSGTALSFELGLLWPGLMRFAGPALGPAFMLEGYAFLVEAIFIGLVLYGWDRLSPRAHLFASVVVALSGCVSGVLVVGANAWLQSPRGFIARGGELVDVDPLAVFANPSWAPLAAHSTFACYAAVGFAVAGVYAVGMLRGRRDAYHEAALRLSLAMGAVAAVLQLASGDRLAKLLHRTQPEKLAAMEALFHGRSGAPLLLGGIPDSERETVRFGLELPRLLSVMSTGSADGYVRGLSEFPPGERPNVLVTHLAFQLMVGSGFALLALAAWFWIARARSRGRGEPRALLVAIALASPLGFLALEAGWVVTEVGRQPWVVYRVMRTAEAVTARDDLAPTALAFAFVYVVLAVALVGILRAMAQKRRMRVAAERRS